MRDVSSAHQTPAPAITAFGSKLPTQAPQVTPRGLAIPQLHLVSADDDFVIRAHRSILDRAPRQAEKDVCLAMLAAGQSRLSVMFELYASADRASALQRADWTFMERHAYGAYELLRDLRIETDPRVCTVLSCALLRRGGSDVFLAIKYLFDRGEQRSSRQRLRGALARGPQSAKSIVRFAAGFIEGNARWADIRVKLSRTAPASSSSSLDHSVGMLLSDNARLEARLIEVQTRLRQLENRTRSADGAP